MRGSIGRRWWNRPYSMASPAGIEPTRLAPEASALSAELRGRFKAILPKRR